MLPRVKPLPSIHACLRLRDRMPSMVGLSTTAQILLGLLLLTVQACDDSTADNYGRPGPCVPKPILYCDDPLAYNFQAHIAGDQRMIRMRHSCRYAIHGCGDSAAANYVPYAGRSAYEGVPAVAIFVHNRSMCQYSGCNDSAAANFDSRATFNDGTCRYRSRGCMDPTSALYL
ncbi:hypothetical protein Ctob_008598, partial [Chrysochromulina tobinii]